MIGEGIMLGLSWIQFFSFISICIFLISDIVITLKIIKKNRRALELKYIKNYNASIAYFSQKAFSGNYCAEFKYFVGSQEYQEKTAFKVPVVSQPKINIDTGDLLPYEKKRLHDLVLPNLVRQSKKSDIEITWIDRVEFLPPEWTLRTKKQLNDLQGELAVERIEAATNETKGI